MISVKKCNTKWNTRFVIIILICIGKISNAQLVVTGGVGPITLVNNILGNGVTISNVTYTGAVACRGSFTAAGTNLGMTSGICLSTGNAVQSGNAAVFAGEDKNQPGDADIDAIVWPNITYDATILEFDFAAASDTAQFNYVFASEEYNEFVNSNFNDAFAFLISGPGIVGQQNIALVPGVGIPVSINNVNNGFATGQSSGPCTNCTYFVDNDGGATIYMDAFTTVLTATAPIQPCQTYHIKIVIADVGDGDYNSAVFIEGGSFTSAGQMQLYANGTVANNNDTIYGCPGNIVNLSLSNLSSYVWSTGATTQNINVVVPSLGIVNQYIAYDSTLACSAVSTTIYVAPKTAVATITASGPTTLCNGGSVVLTANAGAGYLWSNGATTQSINVTTTGSFTVTVTDALGCVATSAPLATVINTTSSAINGPATFCNTTTANLIASAGSSWLWNTGSTLQSLPVSTGGTYIVTVTNANGCTSSSSFSITALPSPSPTISGANAICQGTTAQFTIGGIYNSILWSNGSTLSTISATAAGTYTVTVTNSNGCSGSASHQLIINPLPIPVINGAASICQGNSTILDAGIGYTSYLWNNNSNTQTISTNTGGTYTVTVTDNNGCSASSTLSVIILPLPVASISGNPIACADKNIILNAGAGFANYLWSNGNTTQQINPVQNGNYTVMVTDNNNCSASTSVNVIINPLPVPVINGNAEICKNDTSHLVVIGTFVSYLWSNSSSSSSISTIMPGIYTVSVTDINGCSGSTSFAVAVNQLPTPHITGDTIVCYGNPANLETDSGYNQYIWSNGNTGAAINTTMPGTYIVTVTDGKGCTNSVSANVIVNALPQPVIIGTPFICAGSVSVLNAGSFSSYVWSNSATTQIQNTPLAGTYTVTVTNNNGCTNTTSFVVVLNPLPTPVITGDDSICVGDFTILNAGNFVQFNWSNGSTTQTLNTMVQGMYIVTVTDANGCMASSAPFQVEVMNPVATISTSGALVFCDGEDVTLSANIGNNYLWSNGSTSQTVTVTSTGAYTVTVTNTNGCTATSSTVTVTVLETPDATFLLDSTTICGALRIQFAIAKNPLPGASIKWNFGDGHTSTGPNPVHDFTKLDNVWVSLTIINQNGCIDIDSVPIEIFFPQNPISNFTNNPEISTFLDPGIQFYDSCLNTTNWYWNFGDDEASFEKNPFHYFKEAGEFTVTLVATNEIGCQDVHSETILITPFWIPNTFTPNADGKNDYFITSNYFANVNSFHMTIFNRWGGQVFNSFSFDNPWDGIDLSGNAAQEGTYIYVIDINTKGGKAHKFTGRIDLLR